MREGDAAFAPLEEGYVEHAAPQAIVARLHGLQEKRRRINNEIAALLRLRDERHRQIEEGTWPKKK
jgi:hypothetical protein